MSKYICIYGLFSLCIAISFQKFTDKYIFRRPVLMEDAEAFSPEFELLYINNTKSGKLSAKRKPIVTKNKKKLKMQPKTGSCY